jgi:hypothetical protein
VSLSLLHEEDGEIGADFLTHSTSNAESGIFDARGMDSSDVQFRILLQNISWAELYAE